MTPIDLTQFTGHTPGPWIAQEPIRNYAINQQAHTIFQVTGPYEGDEDYDDTGVAACLIPDEDNNPKTLLEVDANAALIAAAPDILARARELEGEVARLKEHNAEWIERCRQFRQNDAIAYDIETDELKHHAAELAGALLQLADNCDERGDGDQLSIDNARAALAAYNEATGEGVKDDGKVTG